MVEPRQDSALPVRSGDGSQVLASDQRRDQSVAMLSAACADGRLPLEDFSTRVDLALAARTVGELSLLEADLGPAPPPTYPTTGTLHRPPAWYVALLSSTVRRGHWVLHPTSHALAVMGEVKLDLRGADVGARYSHITAVALMGSISVIVPEGINVEVDGLAVMGNKTVRGGADQPLPGAPTVAITALALMGEVKVVTKGPTSKGTELAATLGSVRDHLLDRHQRHAERLQIRADRMQRRAALHHHLLGGDDDDDDDE
ncbi:MAG TPA: DUF1707 domain-containing protein [Candidatus Dormibacteraeota bacterium]|nr:DUF1707 domain-containing protein [Candidatus Dormibacteraeota bacterium]